MSKTQWFLISNGLRQGPISQNEIINLISSGKLNRFDLVWQDGFLEWVPAGSIQGLFQDPPPIPQSQLVTIPQQLFDPVLNRRMIAQLREDTKDFQLFFAEMIRVAVRLNPVNIQIYNFLDFINQVVDGMEREQIAKLVQSAMQQVDLSDAAQSLDQSLEEISSIGPSGIINVVSSLLDVWPDVPKHFTHRWFDDHLKESADLQQNFRNALQRHRQDLLLIQNHFRQLQEFHPRYHEIMNRNNIWDFALGFAAVFFGGSIGQVGAQLWDNWRNQSDTEFAQSFSNAVNQFSQATLEFTQKTEKEVELVLSQFLCDFHEFNIGVISAMDSISDKSDLTKIYTKLHEPDTTNKPHVELKQFLEIVFVNLREQKISPRSETNLRRMLGLQ